MILPFFTIAWALERVQPAPPSGGAVVATNFSAWMGKFVVMNIVNGTSKVPLNCRVVHESNQLVRVRIGDQWDVDIYKEMIEGVQLDGGAQTREAELFEVSSRDYR